MRPSDIIRHELIGLNAEIVEAKNKSLVGLKGKIIDETKNLLIIQSKKGEKKVLKDQVTLKLKMKDKKFKLEGKLLVGKPEDRLKK